VGAANNNPNTMTTLKKLRIFRLIRILHLYIYGIMLIPDPRLAQRLENLLNIDGKQIEVVS
jgi:hypothetical protein